MSAHVAPRHLILDRDGVLNEEAPAGGYIKAPEDWRWIEGARESLALLAQAGIRVSVATNQSGVGRGLMSAAALDAVHARMLRESEEAGGAIDGIYVCMHAPGERCPCRKPAPGLILEALRRSAIGADETLVVGDDLRDLEAAQTAGVSAVLVLTGKGRAAHKRLTDGRVAVYADLRALTGALLAKPTLTGSEQL